MQITWNMLVLIALYQLPPAISLRHFHFQRILRNTKNKIIIIMICDMFLVNNEFDKTLNSKVLAILFGCKPFNNFSKSLDIFLR